VNYQLYPPHPDLASFIKCYWTLEVPIQAGSQRQRILPDGYLEMFFILGDDIKRYTSEDKFIIQPRFMVLGQITEPFFIEPTGYVNCFAVRFYPYGFANLVSMPIKDLANRETPLTLLFGEETANALGENITKADDTNARIKLIENFLFQRLNEQVAVDNIVKTTIDMMFLTRGNTTIKKMMKNDVSKRRQLERRFVKQIGISPKQLCRVIRLQTALKMMLNQQGETFAEIAYDSDYYDQAHFIKDFKDFTGTTPKEFFEDGEMALSSLFYR
jgi:AraC-like DNA-binding protein